MRKLLPIAAAIMLSAPAFLPASAQTACFTAQAPDLVNLATKELYTPAQYMPQPVPNPIALYGVTSWGLATPYVTCRDNFYSGAMFRPCRLDNWYGNGYNW